MPRLDELEIVPGVVVRLDTKYLRNIGGSQANNPLHGITLEVIRERLVAHYGWPDAH